MTSPSTAAQRHQENARRYAALSLAAKARYNHGVITTLESGGAFGKRGLIARIKERQAGVLAALKRTHQIRYDFETEGLRGPDIISLLAVHCENTATEAAILAWCDFAVPCMPGHSWAVYSRARAGDGHRVLCFEKGKRRDLTKAAP